MAVLDAIATAYLDRERARLGLPSRRELEEKRAIEARAAAESASRLESADLARQQTRQNMELLPELTTLRAETARAQAEAAKARAEREPQPTGPAAVAALTPEQQAAFIDFQSRLSKATRAPKEPAGISPAVESTIINRLTTQWDKANTTINELKRQRDLMHTGLAAARKGDMAAGSQAVLVTFQKILDPTSVVRESEYARSAAGQSLLSRVQGAFDRIRAGGAGVPVHELEAFAALADQFVENATNSANVNTIRGRIGATADRYGIPHDVIFGAEMPETAAPAVIGPGGAAASAAPAEEFTYIEVAPGIRKKVRK